MANRIGVDIGGTFTDVICYDDLSGEVRVAKVPTTPDALERGVLEGVQSALRPGMLAESQFFMHGTTVGLNALLQRSGATIGLLCTQGFRDSLEIRRADRDATSMYNLFWRPPVPLVPRRRRLPVQERTRADGHIIEAVSDKDVTKALDKFREAGVQAIAVCYMNAYANPTNEKATEAILRAAGFDGEISLSHRLSREYREYERTSTTVIDAYIRRVTSTYIEELSNGLRADGFNGQVLVTRSGGGALTELQLRERPFEAIQSGPVAGAHGAAELCRAQGWNLGIAADVGGTSFDATLIVDGWPQLKHEGSIGGWPIQAPWVDVNSIGAGGGSVAYADGGLLRVGPRSAGAMPGPACYGRGGTEPTVTDAALALGMLGDGVLTSEMSLDRTAATAALEPLARALGLSVPEAAQGILRVVTAAMGDVIREITIGQGQDPRDAKLIAFGGAGPLFGTLLATELELHDVVVPPHAGNFSAWGLLGQDITHDSARTLIKSLDDATITEINSELRGMFRDLTGRENDAGGNGSTTVDHVVGVDIRYAGQDHSLTIRKAADGDQLPWSVDALREEFTAEYVRRFGTSLDLELELVTVRATLRLPLPRRAAEHLVVDGESTTRHADLFESYSFTGKEWREFRQVERAQIAPGRRVAGPAIVWEPTATTYVDAGFAAQSSESGLLVISSSAS